MIHLMNGSLQEGSVINAPVAVKVLVMAVFLATEIAVVSGSFCKMVESHGTIRPAMKENGLVPDTF